jgi:shikimate kinase / 3-dehydroquinate synthase
MKPDRMIFLYGPPGSGKSAIGAALAAALARPFFDLDAEIEQKYGRPIRDIFTEVGEKGFRIHEKSSLEELTNRETRGVVALGGGALLDEENRALVESIGQVLCLSAPVTILRKRISEQPATRPLIDRTDYIASELNPNPNGRLEALLAERAAHYGSFPLNLETGTQPVEGAAWQAQIKLGTFRISSMDPGHEVLVRENGLAAVGEYLRQAGLSGPVALVSDNNVASRFAPQILSSLESAAYTANLVCLPPGESAKNLHSASRLWSSFLEMGLERSSTVLALGGGVIGDLAGFAAAVFLRGLPWVALPTSLLAMVDASLGGKTAIDLPEGKNLVGAFYPPRLVLADPLALEQLPEEEIRSGLAEVVKAGIIADPELFRQCAGGIETISQDWGEAIRRSMAVKIKIVQEDPFERGRREALNLGHTIGHALEAASSYKLRHGEAVAVGLVMEARLAERLGLAQAGMSAEISQTLTRLGLPVSPPDGLAWNEILVGLRRDKKRAGGKIRFSLPLEIGKVTTGIPVEEKMICELFSSCTDLI